jgi:hypothetical protein
MTSSCGRGEKSSPGRLGVGGGSKRKVRSTLGSKEKEKPAALGKRSSVLPFFPLRAVTALHTCESYAGLSYQPPLSLDSQICCT